MDLFASPYIAIVDRDTNLVRVPWKDEAIVPVECSTETVLHEELETNTNLVVNACKQMLNPDLEAELKALAERFTEPNEITQTEEPKRETILHRDKPEQPFAYEPQKDSLVQETKQSFEYASRVDSLIHEPIVQREEPTKDVMSEDPKDLPETIPSKEESKKEPPTPEFSTDSQPFHVPQLTLIMVESCEPIHVTETETSSESGEGDDSEEEESDVDDEGEESSISIPPLNRSESAESGNIANDNVQTQPNEVIACYKDLATYYHELVHSNMIHFEEPCSHLSFEETIAEYKTRIAAYKAALQNDMPELIDCPGTPTALVCPTLWRPCDDSVNINCEPFCANTSSSFDFDFKTNINHPCVATTISGSFPECNITHITPFPDYATMKTATFIEPMTHPSEIIDAKPHQQSCSWKRVIVCMFVFACVAVFMLQPIHA